MAQTSTAKRLSFADLNLPDKQCNLEAYVEQKDRYVVPIDVFEPSLTFINRLLQAIDSTTSILGDLRRISKDEWVVRYPKLGDRQSGQDAHAPRPSKLRRTLSFADNPTCRSDVVLTPRRKGMMRSITLSTIQDVSEDGILQETHEKPEEEEEESVVPEEDDFHILRLDLKLGTHGSSTSPDSLVSQLEKSSIANLLDERMSASASHLAKLRQRVEDKSSKVLVTGDLNAGKSTFVNALLRREVMPVDQQPCTAAFCEVHDASENHGKEEIHVLKDGVEYSIDDETTFTRGDVDNLEEIFSQHEGKSQPVLKVYLSDTGSQSLLNNGVVDISLIDAPGLNRDSIKTTAVFARQEEIDVVVFVVSAENHFTLSAKEFLLNASKEKAYLFIVVNKFEQIKNKAKCQQFVYQQIKELSPTTYRDRDELVHFVDSAAALQPSLANPKFDDLESALRAFVLAKRSKSKLQPVSTYLGKLLMDIELLTSANALVAEGELAAAKAHLEQVKPLLEEMKVKKDGLDNALDTVEDEGVTTADQKTKELLYDALERVGQGKLGFDSSSLVMPSYPGLFGIWSYTKQVKQAFLLSLDLAVKAAEDEARLTTTAGVRQIGVLAETYLPTGVERNSRVFMPQAMFSLRRLGKKGKRGQAIVAGGLVNLGIGLAHRIDMAEVSFADLCDLHHIVSAHFGHAEHEDDHEDSLKPSALSVISLAAGALTMVGGQAIGLRGMVDGMLWLGDVMSDDRSRKWVAPLIGAGAIGYMAYLVLDLPHSVPRTVGRRVRRKVLSQGKKHGGWVEEHVGRVHHETRKVLGIASYDLKKRYRDALEERGQDVGRSEDTEKKAERAKRQFELMVKRAGEVRAGLVVSL
jgi:mitofusin 2